jgi:hypothetical protein
MAWFNPTLAEISAIEQIEAVMLDDTLNESQRQKRVEKLWVLLEEKHGSRVLNLVSPEGTVIRSPFVNR